MGRACAVNCTTGAALIFLGFCLVPETAFAASSGDTHDAVEKTIPQGKDPPGTDEEQGTAPPAEHKGVIPPPPVGDQGIYTKVPNPEAGHEKEVIPPPGRPGGNPNVEPRSCRKALGSIGARTLSKYSEEHGASPGFISSEHFRGSHCPRSRW